MSAGWVAVSVRARAMAQRRRLGRHAARAIATAPSLDDAITTLSRTAYGRDVVVGQRLADAQRAVVATMLWNLRVLAGWAPREGAAMLRVLLGVIETVNVEDHLRRLDGSQVPAPYHLGSLGTAWSRVAAAGSAAEVRRELASSPWGDPGGDTLAEIGPAMRAALVDRVVATVPAAAEWAAGAAALLLAREVALGGRALPPAARSRAARVLGPRAPAATRLTDQIAALPPSARWALAGVTDPRDLWLAEARWWARVEHDAEQLSRAGRARPETLVGAVGLLAADARRVRAALEIAAAQGTGLEVFDATA